MCERVAKPKVGLEIGSPPPPLPTTSCHPQDEKVLLTPAWGFFQGLSSVLDDLSPGPALPEPPLTQVYSQE